MITGKVGKNFDDHAKKCFNCALEMIQFVKHVFEVYKVRLNFTMGLHVGQITNVLYQNFSEEFNHVNQLTEDEHVSSILGKTIEYTKYLQRNCLPK